MKLILETISNNSWVKTGRAKALITLLTFFFNNQNKSIFSIHLMLLLFL